MQNYRVLPPGPTVEPHPMVARIMQCFAGGGYTNGASPMNKASQEAWLIEQEIRADERKAIVQILRKRAEYFRDCEARSVSRGYTDRWFEHAAEAAAGAADEVESHCTPAAQGRPHSAHDPSK